MHFIGDGNNSAPAGEPSDAGASGELPMPRYRVAVMMDGEKTWLDWMCGMRCECGHCDDTYAGIPGIGIVDVEFDGGSLGPKGWFTKNMKGNKLIGLTVFYDTPHPEKTGYYAAMYRVHWGGGNPGWGKYEYDDDDGGAGNDKDQLDMIELTIVKC